MISLNSKTSCSKLIRLDLSWNETGIFSSSNFREKSSVKMLARINILTCSVRKEWDAIWKIPRWPALKIKSKFLPHLKKRKVGTVLSINFTCSNDEDQDSSVQGALVHDGEVIQERTVADHQSCVHNNDLQTTERQKAQLLLVDFPSKEDTDTWKNGVFQIRIRKFWASRTRKYLHGAGSIHQQPWIVLWITYNLL